MIPKVIHYCWFGGNPLPKSAQKCIASWRKYLPDYEIKEWNESNFDVNIIPYTAEAYKACLLYTSPSPRRNMPLLVIMPVSGFSINMVVFILIPMLRLSRIWMIL